MHMDLLCCRDDDSNVLHGRAVTVLERLKCVLFTHGLMGLPVVPSPSLAARNLQDVSFVTGEVAATLSVRERRCSPV